MSTTTTPAPHPLALDGHPTAMRAIVHDRYGPPEVLHLATVARPVPSADEVLVRVRAASVGRSAWHFVAGKPYVARLVFGLRRPRQPIAGIDLAGVVEAVGADVTRFAPGDEVVGIARGTFAELVVAKEAKLSAKPPSLPFVEAAAMPDCGGTALRAVRDLGGVRHGQRALVLGASGGVGSFAVQIAKGLGAEVTATARTSKVAFVRGLGADHVVDHTTDDPIAEAGQYDVIIDIGGNRRLRRLRRALTPTGTLVIVGGESAGELLGGIQRQGLAALWSLVSRRKMKPVVVDESHRSTDALVELVEAGSLRPAIDRTYPLAEAADAMARLEAGDVCGKVVLEV